MGLAEAMTKSASAVEELIMVAEGDQKVLEDALRRAESEAGRETREQTEPVSASESDAPISDAPALLARRLLSEALEEVRGCDS
jgi:hypothetical protein